MKTNLTILERSPYDVPPSKLKDIKVWGTMPEGHLQPVPAVPQTTSSSKRIPEFQTAASTMTEENAFAAAEAAHHHREGDCCSCAMNRAFASVMFAGDR